MRFILKFNSPMINSSQINFLEKIFSAKCNRLMFCSALSFLNICLLIVSIVAGGLPLYGQIKENPVWSRPVQVPVPVSVSGVSQPVVSLRGTWKVAINPQNKFWDNSADITSWRDVQVPSRWGGVSREQLVYKTRFSTPKDFKGKRAIIRFEGVSGLAKVWVNGVYIREHWGNLMPWTCDVTDHVVAGEQAWLTVSVDDRQEGLANAVQGGGITRDVKLIAAPQDYITRFHVSTDFDSTYTNAVLKVWVTMAFNRSKKETVRFILKDRNGNQVPIEPSSVEIASNAVNKFVQIPVKSPLKWDAEHPNLYSLEAQVIQGSEVQQKLLRNVGFRKLERIGNLVLINGKEVKLRGLWGGNDVKNMRAANINHTRQKWVTEEFLNECDSLGMYVLDEVPIDFALNGVESDPRFLNQYLSLTADLIERDRSHPSVIIWGMGNESWYGSNVAKTLQYADVEDSERLTFFSWGNRTPAGEEPPFTVYSSHYANWDNDPGKSAMRLMQNIPILHDEYAHIPWYDNDMMRLDPNIHNFWGESIFRWWENIFTTKGALGGDIFAFSYFNNRGEEKPEYWHMKKAYSPVRISKAPLLNPGERQPLTIPVKNWFDHTKLSELSLEWTCGDESGSLTPPPIEPHTDGTLTLPARNWKNNELVSLKFFDRNKQLIDTYDLQIAPTEHVASGFKGPVPSVTETDEILTVSGQDFIITFNKKTGLIINGSYKGVQVIKSGPFLHLSGSPFLYKSGGLIQNGTCQSISYVVEKEHVCVVIKRNEGPVNITYRVNIDGQGLMVVGYSFNPLPEMVPPMVNNTQMRDVGGFKEIGISFLLTSGVDRLSWQRNGLWSVYPKDHIGRNTGVAFREPKGSGLHTWSQEDRDPSLFGRYDIGGRGTRDFRSLKEYIYSASAVVGETGASLRAESLGEDAVRLEVVQNDDVLIDDTDSRIKYQGQWKTLLAQDGAYKGTTSISGDGGSSIEFTFEGHGIAWTGSPVKASAQASVGVAGAEDAGFGQAGSTSGQADIFIDGTLVETDLNLSRRVERRYSDAWPLVLFSKEGLSEGRHTIKIVPKSSGVTVDFFHVLRANIKGDVRMIYANQWNYPDLSWGNYVKSPQITGTFYQNAVRVRLTDSDKGR